MRAFRGFVWKEVLHLLRDRQTLAILLLMPVVQVLLFGYAVRTDVRDIPITIIDPTPGQATEQLRDRFQAAGRYLLISVQGTEHDLDRQFRTGEVRQALLLPPDLDRQLIRGEKVSVGLITDASDPNTGSVMEAYANAVLARWISDHSNLSRKPAVTLLTRMRFNPTLESVNLFVPGLIAYVLTIISAMMTALSITREKESGTMEMLLVSPLHPVQIVIGKVVPYIVLGMSNVLLLLASALLIFGVPFRGSLLLMLAASFVYILVSLGMGIVISTSATTQRAAQLAALAGLLLPTMMLSGFIFPIEALPLPLQIVSNIVPARWFLVVVRGIMAKGTGLTELWQELTMLLGMMVLILGVGIRRLAVRLD